MVMRMIMMMKVGKMMVKDRLKIIKMMLLVITLPAEARFLQCELVGKKQALPSTILFSIVHAWVFSWNSLANEINRNIFHQIAWVLWKSYLQTTLLMLLWCTVVFIFLILAANLLKEKTPPVSLDHHAFRKAYANNWHNYNNY